MQFPILARSPSAPKPVTWRGELKTAFRSLEPLMDHLELDSDRMTALATPRFPILIPRPFVARMRKGDPNDPLLRQVLPHPGEMESVAGFSSDPVGDQASRAQRGLLHKYKGRVLLITTGACAVHCRYCFRQAYPYAQDHFSGQQLGQLLEYLKSNSDVEEVILSGGDPLMLDTSRLAALTDALRSQSQIKRLRLHTRLPIVLPSRVDQELIDWIETLPWQVVLVVHANHAAEFDGKVDAAMALLRRAGATVFNQSVLLAGINDSSDALAALMRRSFEAGVIPYYLHLLGRVEGAARFEQHPTRALELMEALRIELSGYLVPRLVREQAGAPYKLPVL
ncbi:MAG: EF-P beta-lysylation protein EpmB [Pseudomonadota bacterium]